MKKIGIVSCFWSENYGAILQALGLQAKLKEAGFDAYYINYAEKYNIPGAFRKLLNRAYERARLLLGYRKRLARTRDFRSKHLSLTAPIADYSTIGEHIRDLDILMVGSDQMWRPSTMGVQSGYFLLAFSDDKPKYTYATSFGVSKLPEGMRDIYQRELGKFKKLSVRENTGKEILASLGLECEVVTDPTLLLSGGQWLAYFDREPLVKDKYILCYVMNGDHKTADFVRRYSRQVDKQLGGGYRILVLGDKEYKKFKPGYNLLCDCGPAEFLNLLYNASYVITSSFHGTCFSINFDKQFTTVLDRNNPVNSRITDLLASLDLSQAVRYTDADPKATTINKIDNRDYHESLRGLRDRGLDYIATYIGK